MEEKGLFEERGCMQIGGKTSTSNICIQDGTNKDTGLQEELATLGSKDRARSRAMVVKGTGPVAGRPTNALDAAWLDPNEKK